MEHLDSLINKNSNWANGINMLETRIHGGLYKSVAEDTSVIDIPVVVHVIYNTSAQNISDAQIQSQITVLNQDYRRIISTPGYNSDDLGADTHIQFHLAIIDSNGIVSSGITRTQTSVTSFSDDDAVKYSSSGGHNAWDCQRYLNIWVCNLSGGLLGYAQFPNYYGTVSPYATSTDGVVILYSAFGNTGIQAYASHYDMGRTASHEVGHWLGLRHIWGDVSDCSGTDYVEDTYPCSGPYYSGETGYSECGVSVYQCSGYRRQTEDYMDYSDDRCMNLFT
jgi:hypothetical protein